MKLSAIVDSVLDWLRSLWGGGERETQQPESPPASRVVAGGATAAASPVEPLASPGSQTDAQAYLDKVRDKIDKLAADFNDGTINRAQFRSLYVHYQHELQSVERMIEEAPASDEWKHAVTEGLSVVIRRQHLARARGYAIFQNDSGMPLSTLGQFEVDPALLVPMLSSYRSAAQEIFGAGTRSTEVEDGRWLCFVPGEFTTMLAVFSAEPAGKQLEFLSELHRQFERANRRRLSTFPIEAGDLLFPHEYYLGQWRRS